MLLNQTNLTILNTAFNAAFKGAFTTAQSDYAKVAMDVPSTTLIEDYSWLGLTTSFREWLGDRVIQNLKTHGYTIRNKSFENTIGVDRDKIDDDQYGVYTPMFQQLGMDAKTHPDTLVFPQLANGFTQICYDGQNFFDTDHPVVDANGNVQSVANTDGGAGTPWYLLDMSRPIKPIIFQKRRDYNMVPMDKPDDEHVFMRKELRYGVDARVNVGYGLWQLAWGSKQTLDAAHFEAAHAALSSLKGDNARPLGIRPSLLVVPPSLRAAAFEVVQAQRLASGASNINYQLVDVLVTPWLA